MKILCIITVIASSFFIHHGAFARETMNQKYEKVAVLGKNILEARSIDSRQETIDYLKKKYAFIPWVWHLIPTYDVSKRYTPYIQKYKLSCEIAAIKMVMDTIGKPVSEDDIIFRIPVFSWSYSSGGIWGNPEKEFVGDIHGSQYKKTWYGIYEEPLIQYLNNRWITAKKLNAFTYQKWMSAHKHLWFLLKKIQQWHHVILWGDYCTTPSEEDGILVDDNYKTLLRLFPIAAKNQCDRTSDERWVNWKTPDGIDVQGLSWEHAFILLWFVGNISHPSHIIVWDTATGRHIFSYNEWMRKWSLLEFRSLIVSDKDL